MGTAGHRVGGIVGAGAVLALSFGLAGAAGVGGGSPSSLAAGMTATSPAGDAAEACLLCHDGPAVTPILRSPHATAPHGGFAERGCATCHGESQGHLRNPMQVAPDVVFAGSRASPPAEQERACLGCHRGKAGLHWQGSAHEVAGLACTACHDAHAERHPVLERATQAEVCFACHRGVRAEALRPSAHPLLDGRVACTDCHAPHGGPGPALLTAGTVNDTCFGCHAEKRGPFLWEHPPAREDCLNCHRPHGAAHASLLAQRTPFLCQQCHLAQFHPSTALSGTGLPGESLPSGSTSLLGRDCRNCHAQVHGSNHPSGAGLTR